MRVQDRGDGVRDGVGVFGTPEEVSVIEDERRGGPDLELDGREHGGAHDILDGEARDDVG